LLQNASFINIAQTDKDRQTDRHQYDANKLGAVRLAKKLEVIMAN